MICKKCAKKPHLDQTSEQCQFACKVKKSDCAKIEKALHTAFAPQRINANREFFRIQVEQAKAILELFHHEDVTEEVSDEIDNDLTDDDKAASAKAVVRRPSLNFYEMGMQKGDVLHWKDGPSITVTVNSERRVIYQDGEVSISALSAQLKGYKSKDCECYAENDGAQLVVLVTDNAVNS